VSLIHPTAVVDPRAELAPGVRVGPYAVIGPEVCLGEGVEVGAHAVLEGRVRVAPRARLGHGAVIGTPPQDLKYREGTPSGVSIGEDTVIRELSTVHRATREGRDTRIGRGCLLMATTHVGHDCTVGDHVIMINGSVLAGHVTVEDRVTLGGLSGAAPFTRLGTYAYIGGLSAAGQDVPPFVIARNAPARAFAVNVIGMRRGGIAPADRRAVQKAFRILYRAGLSPRAATARLKSELGGHPLVDQLIAFVESSRQGIIKPGAAADEPPTGSETAEEEP
jgi:UDP-N-acetylglucosamine acyltransferase